MRTASLLAALLLLPFTALAARAPDAGPPDAGPSPVASPVEVDVRKGEDGGYVVTPPASPDPDAGTPEAPQLLPPELLADSPAPYPEALRAQRVSAVVRLELLVDDKGEVAEVTVLEGAQPEFNLSATEAARKLRFRPATLGGTPVPVRLLFSYRFEVPPEEEQAPERGRLKGLVRTKGNRRPIPNASVYFPTTEQTVAVDANGRFEVDLPEGVNWAQVSAPGHRSESFREQLRVNETLDVIYGLEPLVVNPYETIVRGDRERTEVSRVTLRDQELREVPGTQGDPFRVVMLLPGVSSVASGVSYPIVRGTQPAATGYFIDGIRVPLLFHLFLGPAVVHPDFIEAIDFFPGAPPPRYGRLMGGAIEGHISRPREDRVHATLYADLMNAGVFVEAPIKETGTSFTAAGRISYTPWLIAIIANTQPGLDRNSRLVLDFYDYQARIEQKVGPGSLRLFAFGSSDVVGTAANNEQGFTALQSVVFHRVDLRYRQPVGEGEVEAGVTLGLDRLRFEATGGRQTGILFSLDDKSLKARAGYTLRLLPELRLETGADLDRREADVRVSFTVPQNPQDPNSPINTVDLSIPVAVGTLIGGWVQAVYTGIPKLTLIPGLRLDSYHLVPRIDNFVAEPRLTARYALTDGVTLKAAGGVFHQAPVTLINLPAVDMGSLRFGVQRGVQTDIGVEWKVREGLEVNADVYFNPILRSLELSPFEQLQGQLPQPGQDPGEVADAIIRRQITTGYAYGFELLVRHPLGGNWFGWLSYSLQRSVRRKEIVRRDEFGDEIGRDTVDLPFTYDQTHVLNAVLSYKFEGGWTVGGVVHFNTGRPETGVLTSLTQRQGVSRFGDPAWIPVDQDKADRLPAFFRVDARVAKTWAFDLFTLEAYLDVLNLGLSQEVISFNYSGGGAGPEGEPTPLEKQPVAIPIFLPVLGLKASY